MKNIVIYMAIMFIGLVSAQLAGYKETSILFGLILSTGVYCILSLEEHKNETKD